MKERKKERKEERKKEGKKQRNLLGKDDAAGDMASQI